MKHTLQFLKKLKSNNNRDWFEANRESYEQAKAEFESFVNTLLVGVKKFDTGIDPALMAKQCMFRINRDVRFSKDKSPYKTNMGASIAPGGRKSTIAGYYLHIEPGNSFLAGGVYMPEPPQLQAIRQEIDYNGEPLVKLLKSAAFKKYFKGLDEEGKLARAPKGYGEDHPLIDVLKNKHFIVSHALTDAQVTDAKAVNYVVSGMKAMHPFLEYLRITSE
jgi:uncharacterized protein (TIGR02453 family)